MMKAPALKATLFATTMSAETLPFLTDHRVYGTMVASGGLSSGDGVECSRVGFRSRDGVA